MLCSLHLKQIITHVLAFIASVSESRWKIQNHAKVAALWPLGHSSGEIKKVFVTTLANNCDLKGELSETESCSRCYISKYDSISERIYPLLGQAFTSDCKTMKGATAQPEDLQDLDPAE